MSAKYCYRSGSNTTSQQYIQALQPSNGSNEQKWPLRKTLIESNKIMSMIYKVNIENHRRI